MNKAELLQKLYDSEINCLISTFWDNGFDWKLGDEMNGFSYEGNAATFDKACVAIFQTAVTKFPDSDFANFLLSVGGIDAI